MRMIALSIFFTLFFPSPSKRVFFFSPYSIAFPIPPVFRSSSFCPRASQCIILELFKRYEDSSSKPCIYSSWPDQPGSSFRPSYVRTYMRTNIDLLASSHAQKLSRLFVFSFSSLLFCSGQKNERATNTKTAI